MQLSDIVKKDKSTLDRYIFYRGLGYSVEMSELLSCLTYGDDDLARRVKKARKKDLLRVLRSWVQSYEEEQEDEEPDDFFDDFHVRSFCSGSSSVRSFDSSFGNEGAGANPALKEISHSFPVARYSLDCITGRNVCGYEEAGYDSFFSSSDLLEQTSTDAYELIEEKSAKNVSVAPTSTFRMTTSSASVGILFNQLCSGRRISLNQVRIEEVLNYFDYAAEIPTGSKFAISTELLPKSEDKKLLYVNVQACEDRREHQNVVVLLDVSGSMCGEAVVTQATVAAILSKLRPGDKFSLVTYSNEDHIVVDGYTIRDSMDKEHLMGIVLGLVIYGGTYGSAGIETAYRIGEKYFREGWSNQVMLITDGDLNFGITEKGGLQDLIEDKKKSGLFLSVIGTGLYNYKDDNLETLAKHGNGTYCVVNSLSDVTESIDRHYIALTNIIAKDVKAQVEFNPRFVAAYRLLGYENRTLAHEDFTDDAVISEPYGSGGHGVALYELTMGNGAAQSGLKYQTPQLTDFDELCTVKIRYKEPLADVSHELEKVVYDDNNSTKNTQLAWLLYCVSEKLRESDKLDEADEEYLDRMLTNGAYKDLAVRDPEKLTLFVESMLLNTRF